MMPPTRSVIWWPTALGESSWLNFGGSDDFCSSTFCRGSFPRLPSAKGVDHGGMVSNLGGDGVAVPNHWLEISFLVIAGNLRSSFTPCAPFLGRGPLDPSRLFSAPAAAYESVARAEKGLVLLDNGVDKGWHPPLLSAFTVGDHAAFPTSSPSGADQSTGSSHEIESVFMSSCVGCAKLCSLIA